MARDSARGTAALVGFLLLAAGLLGLVDNPLVGERALFVVSQPLDVVHLALGACLFAISFASRDESTWSVLVAVGVALTALTVALLVDPSLAGRLSPRANPPLVAGYGLLAVVAIGVGVGAYVDAVGDRSAEEW